MKTKHKSAVLGLALCILSTPTYAWLIQGGQPVGTGTVLLLSNSGAPVSSVADNFFGLASNTGPRTSSFNSFIFPFPATIHGLKFTAHTQPITTRTFVATIEVNGSPTSATCTVSSTLAVCNWTGSISVSAGDIADIKVHPTGTPTASIVSASVGYTPTTANDTALSAWTGGGFSTTVASYTAAFQTTTPGTNIATFQLEPFPDGGTVDKLYIQAGAPGSGKSFAYNVMKTAVASALTTTISNTSTTGNDTANSFSVVADTDYIEFRNTPTSSPSAGETVYGVRYVPTTAARYALGFNGISAPSTSVASFWSLTVGGNASSTEASVKNITHSQTFERITVKFATAPGAGGSGKKWAVALRVNGVDSALKCDVLETAKVCTLTGTVSVGDSDFVSIGVTPTLSPTSSAFGMSLLARR